MLSRNFTSTGLLAAVFAAALNAVRTSPYAPSKHNSRRKRQVGYAKKIHRDGCKAARKGIPGVPRGIETGIGVNGIRGASGAGREPGGATTTLCKRTERRSLSQRWSR